MKKDEVNVEAQASDRPEDSEKLPEVFKHEVQEILCILCLALAPCCGTMSMGAYTTAIPNTLKSLGIDESQSAWLVGSISLANGATLLVMGSLADSIGRKNCVLIGFGGYALFTLVGGFMNSLVSLSIFRALSGIVNSLALTASYGIIGSTYVQNSRRKSRSNSIVSAGNPLGTFLGNFTGAICVQFVGSWRDVHYFMAILYGFLTVLAWFVVPKDHPFNLAKFKAVLHQLDYLGIALSTCGFTLICFSLIQANVAPAGWDTPYIIGLLVTGVVLIAGLAAWEICLPKYLQTPDQSGKLSQITPLIPIQIFNRNFVVCAITTSFTSMVFLGVLTFYTNLYFQQILGNTPILTAVKLLPMLVSGIGANYVCAMIMHLVSGQVILLVATLCYLVASIIWATMSLHRNYFLGPFWALWILVSGADLQFNVTSLVTYSSVPKSLQSSGSGLLNMFNRISGAVGLAVSSTIVAGALGAGSAQVAPDATFSAYRHAYYFAIGCSAVAVISCAFLRVGPFR